MLIHQSNDYNDKLAVINAIKRIQVTNNTNMRLDVSSHHGQMFVTLRTIDGRKIFLEPDGREYFEPILDVRRNELEDFNNLLLKLEILFNHTSNDVKHEQGRSLPSAEFVPMMGAA